MVNRAQFEITKFRKIMFNYVPVPTHASNDSQTIALISMGSPKV
jgi:hypothetical protein